MRRCLSIEPDGRFVVLGKDRRFGFDTVLGPDSCQEDVYAECVRPLVDSCFAGYNASVLAYGQVRAARDPGPLPPRV